jgi:four helix bundle suffix protein
LEKDFLEQGGLRERMTRARLQHRNKLQPPPNP